MNSVPKSQIGSYKILAQIGKGGMGEVFLAEDTRLKRRVALKILPENIASDHDRLLRFEREARAISALNHPNILTIFEFGTAGGKHFLASEFVKGETLRERLNRKKLTLTEMFDIALQIASALDAAHAGGIIHRDIKPENVMIREDGYVKVLDFGLAKPVNLSSSESSGEAATQFQTDARVIMGTASYMSPEQALGKTLDTRSDIFSFGALLYEMLTQRQAFTGETTIQTMAAILEKEPPPFSAFVRDYPAQIERIIKKALEKNPDERYQTIGDLLSDLKELKRELDFQAQLEQSFPPETMAAETQSFSAETISESQSLPPTNLSESFQAIVGREREITEIRNLITKTEARLVTLTGVGGTGKTTLARAAARDLLYEFLDGVYFIDLSAIENAELVVPIIAQTLGVQETGGKPLKECLREFLQGRKVLLVLDNFEQITAAALQISELLAGSASLKILITSRIRLNLRFEHEFILQPLEVPNNNRLDINELKKYPAVALFIERAKAAKSNFTLTEGNAGSVVEICRRLDGLPLAIELAAVRVKLLAPQAILTRLANSLNLLTGGARDLPERQQTMRAAIQWSYDLLDREERRLMNHLSVFSGGFTFEAAEAVANADNHLNLDLLDGIASLADKSLLVQREQPDGEPRFRMLEVVREFAFEKLAESGKADEIKRLHAGFYTSLAESAEPELSGGQAAEWLETLEQEYDNLRSALEWSLENEPETALRIVGAIFRFWIRRGYLAEGFKWSKQALEKSGEETDAMLCARAFHGIGTLSRIQGDSKAAALYCEESLRLSREVGDKQLISYSLGGLGSVKIEQGDLEQARVLTEESLVISREIGDKRQISMRLNSLGEIARGQGDYEAARKYYEEALAFARQESLTASISIGTVNLASVACLLEDYQASRSYVLETLQISEELGDKIQMGNALGIFAALAVAAGEMEKAARLFGAARSIHKSAGYRLDIVDQTFKDRYEGEARAVMGDEAFETEFREGQAMRLKKAIALARETD